MTEISRNGKINVWKKMAEADLGSWVSPKAARIQKFFEDMLVNGDIGHDTYCTNEIDEDIAPVLRGYQLNNYRTTGQDFQLTVCLDLHCCVIHGEDIIEDLMWYLMTKCRPYEACPTTWLEIYQRLENEKMQAQKKTRRSRKAS